MRSVWNLFPERVINLHSITHYLCLLLSLVRCLFACVFCYLKLLYYLIAFFISLSLFFVLALLCDGVFRNNSFHSISLFMFFIICLHQLLRQAPYHFCVKQEGKKRKGLRVFLFWFFGVFFSFSSFAFYLVKICLLSLCFFLVLSEVSGDVYILGALFRIRVWRAMPVGIYQSKIGVLKVAVVTGVRSSLAWNNVRRDCNAEKERTQINYPLPYPAPLGMQRNTNAIICLSTRGCFLLL